MLYLVTARFDTHNGTETNQTETHQVANVTSREEAERLIENQANDDMDFYINGKRYAPEPAHT